MKTLLAQGIVAAALLSSALMGCTQEDSHSFTVDRKTVDGLPTVTATEMVKASATVDAIDYDDRSIALTGPKGNTEIFRVTQDVRNFGQIKKGDTVKVEYYNKIYASVRKVSEAPSSISIDSSTIAKLGEKPGIVCSRQAVVLANVESIDYTTRVLKLKTSLGDNMTLTADPKLQDLDKVHAGDQVVFDYTEVISITVN